MIESKWSGDNNETPADDGELNNYIFSKIKGCEENKSHESYKIYWSGLVNYWEKDEIISCGFYMDDPFNTRFQTFDITTPRERELVDKVYPENWDMKKYAYYARDIVKDNWYIGVPFTGYGLKRKISNIDMSGVL